MKQETVNDYSIVFYNNNKVVSVGSITSTLPQVRNIVDILANSDGHYLPNKGKYDLVGFVKTFDLYEMIDNIEEEFDSYKQVLNKIAEAIAIPGEIRTDGECLDDVFSILEDAGFDMKEMLKKAEEKYNNKGE